MYIKKYLSKLKDVGIISGHSCKADIFLLLHENLFNNDIHYYFKLKTMDTPFMYQNLLWHLVPQVVAIQ